MHAFFLHYHHQPLPSMNHARFDWKCSSATLAARFLFRKQLWHFPRTYRTLNIENEMSLCGNAFNVTTSKLHLASVRLTNSFKIYIPYRIFPVHIYIWTYEVIEKSVMSRWILFVCKYKLRWDDINVRSIHYSLTHVYFSLINYILISLMFVHVLLEDAGHMRFCWFAFSGPVL